jgi:hypothetical protein
MKGWKKSYQASGPWKEKEAVVLKTDKVGFESKLPRRGKEGHFILTKGAIKLQEITIINLYVPNVGASNVIKHILLDL